MQTSEPSANSALSAEDTAKPVGGWVGTGEPVLLDGTDGGPEVVIPDVRLRCDSQLLEVAMHESAAALHEFNRMLRDGLAQRMRPWWLRNAHAPRWFVAFWSVAMFAYGFLWARLLDAIR